jgi:hypothetical protein
VAQVAVCSQINTKRQTVLFKDPVRTALQTLFNSVIKTNQFILSVAQVAVCSQINTKTQTALFKDPVRTAL